MGTLEPGDIYRALVLCNMLEAMGHPQVWEPDPIFLFKLSPVKEDEEAKTHESPEERVGLGVQSNQKAVPLNIVRSSIPPNQKSIYSKAKKF